MKNRKKNGNSIASGSWRDIGTGMSRKVGVVLRWDMMKREVGVILRQEISREVGMILCQDMSQKL
jgi:uncharacterized membrane protein (UPF0127 family)